jgi:DNA replication protein DnaC
MHQAGIPARYREVLWDGVEEQDARDWQASVMLEPNLRRGKGLLIAGPVGTGKSSIAACIARDTLAMGKSARWEYVPDMLDELTDGRLRIAVEGRQIAADVLVWDDFGVGKLADWQIPLLDRVVERRYSRRKSMIITTNEQVSSIVSDPALARIVDRWKQTNKVLVIDRASRRREEA